MRMFSMQVVWSLDSQRGRTYNGSMTQEDPGTKQESLVQDAIQGDEAALAKFFQANKHRLERMVQLRLNARVQARVAVSDVLQEAYVD